MTHETNAQHPTGSGRREDVGLTAADLAHYLTRLATVHSNPRTGNVALASALKQLAEALKKYGDNPLDGILDVALDRKTRKAQKSRTRKLDLPAELASISISAVERILANPDYLKLQLIELGARRFGISRSKLTRLTRDQVVDAVRAAANHELSIGVISDEARRGGERRSS